MKHYRAFLLPVLFIQSFIVFGQNLPSLLTGKNINSTFAIIAYDEKEQELGIAVATNNIYVGNSTIYIEPDVGAFSVIADTEPKYGIVGLEKLKKGKSIDQVINEVRDNDDQSNFRQIAGIDAKGNVFAFTGKSLKFWNGIASEITGRHYVVVGNQLADEVLSTMSKAFENSQGTLAERLLISLIAGQNAGGQISGKQSAAIVVKGTNNEWYNQIDLRVDNSKKPFEELQTLMNYHYGRIRLNQAFYAQEAGNSKRAKRKLLEAESLLNGWTGMYAKIATANFILNQEDSAVKWIKKGLYENANWSINLPAFYFLRKHPDLKLLIKPDSFNIRDWENALSMLSNLGKEKEVIEEAKKLIAKQSESSYLNFLLGRSYFYEKNQDKAIQYLEKAILMDNENIEAQNLLKKIRSKK